jgi:hypothetical protein
MDPANFESETTAWESAVVGDGGTVSAGRKSLVNALIVSLKADGVWTKIDRLWLYAAENSQSALRDIRGANASTANGSPAFAADDGYTGEDVGAAPGVTKYIDTGFNPSSGTPNFGKNAGHASAWIHSDFTTVNGGVAAGLIDASFAQLNVQMTPRTGAGNTELRINEVTSTGTAVASAAGHVLGNRSTSTAQEWYKNGAGITSPGAIAAHDLLNANVYTLCWHQVLVGPSYGFGGQVSAFSIGGSLTSGEVSDFYDHLRTYMTAVGVP